MPNFNKGPLAFDDCRDIFDRALESDHGITVTCRDHAEAMSLRTRLHYYRKRDREINRTIYPSGHPLHHVSIWERLICPRPIDNVLRVVKRHTDHLIIEPI